MPAPLMADVGHADVKVVERLPGLLGGEPVYWIESVRALQGGALETELGFSDVAAHPYDALVEATVAVLAAVPGVEDVVREDREVIRVRSRGLTPERLGDVVDRFWFERLPNAPVDMGDDLDAGDLLVSPWPTSPPPPVGPAPAVQLSRDGLGLRELRAAVALPPSRRRMWTYLVCGAIPAVGGTVLALLPEGNDGALPLTLGVVNLVIGTRIALRRRRLGMPATPA